MMKCDYVRKEHAEEHVPSRPLQLPIAGADALRKPCAAVSDLLLDLLIGLPRVQVRRQARADDRHQKGQEIGIELDAGINVPASTGPNSGFANKAAPTYAKRASASQRNVF